MWNKKFQRAIEHKKLIDQYQKIYPKIKTELKNINQRLENISSATLTFFGLKEQQKATIDFKELKEYLDKQFRPTETKPKTIPQTTPETP